MENYRGQEIPPTVPIEDYNKRCKILLARLYSGTIHPFKVLITFYDIIDSACSYLKDYFSCTTNCCYCCYIKVDISKLEAELIRHTMLSFTDSLKMKVINRIDPFVKDWNRFRQFNSPNETLKYFQQQIPCAFLVDNRCLIYSIRPYMCRLHWVTTDPEDCKNLEKAMRWENESLDNSSKVVLVNLNVVSYNSCEFKPMQEWLQILL